MKLKEIKRIIKNPIEYIREMGLGFNSSLILESSFDEEYKKTQKTAGISKIIIQYFESFKNLELVEETDNAVKAIGAIILTCSIREITIDNPLIILYSKNDVIICKTNIKNRIKILIVYTKSHNVRILPPDDEIRQIDLDFNIRFKKTDLKHYVLIKRDSGGWGANTNVYTISCIMKVYLSSNISKDSINFLEGNYDLMDYIANEYKKEIEERVFSKL